MCSAGKFLTILTPFPISKILCVLQNYLAPGNLLNLSFLAGNRTVNLQKTSIGCSE